MNITILITALMGFITLVLLVLLIRSIRKNRDSREPADMLYQMSIRLEQLDRMAFQMEEMNRIFSNPRMRGGLGETMMEELIRNWLPPESYRFQYSFSNGQRADAVILMGSYKVAMDAKFSLEQVRGILDHPEGSLPAPLAQGFSAPC